MIMVHSPQFLSSSPLGQSLSPSQAGTHRPLTVHRNWPGQAKGTKRPHAHQKYRTNFGSHLPLVHSQLTIWQVEDAVLELEARTCEGHLGRHDDSGRRGEQKETFAVRLQASGTTQSEKRAEALGLDRKSSYFPCRGNKMAICTTLEHP